MYPSKYTDRLVDSRNHIVEILMERKAKKEGKKLTWKFWEKPEFKKTYNLSLIQVSALLNIYSEQVILNTLNKLQWAWSVNAGAVKQALIEEDAKLKRIQESKKLSECVEVKTEIIEQNSRPSYTKSKISSL